jgi:hypothetical protein
VQDARFFRSQAELCLEIARQLSDRAAADNVRLTAANYLARADELEEKAEVPAPEKSGA